MEEQTLTRRKKILKKIYILILLLFSVEYLGWGEISVFRVGIIPLCLIGILYIYSERKINKYYTYVLFTTVYMIYFSMCLFVTNDNFILEKKNRS